jgi:hypothetical protein
MSGKSYNRLVINLLRLMINLPVGKPLQKIHPFPTLNSSKTLQIYICEALTFNAY